MESLHKLETTIADWYKNVPHLPKNVSKWIAENVWWIVLIAVILGVFGLFTGFVAIAGLSALTASYGAANPYYGAAMMQANVGASLAAAWVALAGLAVSTVVMALAISPLKDQKKKGWDLLFLSDVVYFVIAVIGAVVSFQFFGIISPIIGAAISFYFLFEIRSHFLGHKVKAEEPKKAEDKK